MSKYANNIFLDDKKKNAEAKTEAVEDAQMEVSNAINAARKVVRVAKKGLAAANGAVPFSPLNKVLAQRNVAAAAEDLADLEAMEKEMF